jgi:hypothetical protein
MYHARNVTPVVCALANYAFTVHLSLLDREERHISTRTPIALPELTQEAPWTGLLIREPTRLRVQIERGW